MGRTKKGGTTQDVEVDTTEDCQSETCSGLPVGVHNNYCATYDCHFRRSTRPLRPVRPTVKYIQERQAWRRRREALEAKAGAQHLRDSSKQESHTPTTCKDKIHDLKPHHSKPYQSRANDFAFLPEQQKAIRKAQEDKEYWKFHQQKKEEEEKLMLEHFIKAEARPISTRNVKVGNWAIQRQIGLEKKLNRQIKEYEQRNCPKHDISNVDQQQQRLLYQDKKELTPLLPAAVPSYKLSLSKTPYNYTTRLRKFPDPRPMSPPRDPNRPGYYREDALGAANVQSQAKMPDRRHNRRRYLDDGHLWPSTFVWGL